MLNDNRQQYVIQSNDPKGDEGFGKFLGVIIVFVMFLGVVQVAYDSAMARYRDVIIWLNDTATYLAGFWPF
ncbi:hypothetical protein GOA99_27740 [Sinorhizobium meliloti]|uniref:hypothetical protein n=1 Tax=Sinorhizobium TaxID=28105 RepID=UPI00129651A7|nr:hypothetical protein [Sinorhizobium meliloti]GCA52761.1 hypothetical protein KGO5_05227 [Sinorhizobium sp. KGO-5]MDW9364352.1 hypothetical protein [Sinorhizobium meliloti]MDW9388386.1 hypothetical protein [Sinorhizobium meliloti]MDW9602589.1 hypothetical protein [Sinorhizobium meliloti]MQV06006.1 hypothetical protein [Sinorhizobium meliloti]